MGVIEQEDSSTAVMLRIAQALNPVAHSATPWDNMDAMPGLRYCLITPCRDEAKFARRTLDSVTRQSIPPALWVIVDDGSTDDTPQILSEYASQYDYIRIVRRHDRGDRKLGSGVIDAFYAGYQTIDDVSKYDFICKLDLDLDLPPRYFEILMQKMDLNPRLGSCSGKAYFERDGKQISEKLGDENAIGAAKFFRRECFEQIGGFIRELNWDGIDGHQARMLGWICASWDEPDIRFIHLRPMGTSHKNWWTGRTRWGVGQWYMGTSPVWMLASALYRMTRPPLVIGGIAMIWGYVKSMIERTPRYGTPEFRRFLRRYQWACLLKGKRRATAQLNARQASAWHPPMPIESVETL